jgi:hypothetical protein
MRSALGRVSGACPFCSRTAGSGVRSDRREVATSGEMGAAFITGSAASVSVSASPGGSVNATWTTRKSIGRWKRVNSRVTTSRTICLAGRRELDRT